jgi:hypothetical protein
VRWRCCAGSSYAHEAEIAAHRAEIARHGRTLAQGAAHAPAPAAGEHAAAAKQNARSGTNYPKLIAVLLSLGDLLRVRFTGPKG